MKSLGTRAAALAIILGLSIQAVAAPPSYPLRVRGSERLRIWAEKTRDKGFFKLIVEFEFGTRPAGDGLRPGQGSWLDRGMRSGEPARLEYLASASEASWIINHLRSRGNYFTFECFNTGKGYMQVTRAYEKSVRID